MKQFIEDIAKVCHEANRAYCETIGDKSQLPWEIAPEWQKDSIRKGVSFHLAADRMPWESHEAWLKEKVKDGWVVGPEKDPVQKIHPCMVPFRELPFEQQVKDHLFASIVKAFKKSVNQ